MPPRVSAYEKVTRNMVDNLKETVEKGFESFEKKIDTFDTNQKELFNHQSSKLPLWATLTLTILGSLVTGLIVYGITGK